jgi:hypothetical protein
MKTKRLEIKLSPKQYRELKKYAKSQKVSMAEVIRNLLVGFGLTSEE